MTLTPSSFPLPQTLRCLAVDSDGCVIDSMTEKHEVCFLPALVDIWQLHEWQDLAREIEFEINLYGPTRGLNRFAALALFFQRLISELKAQGQSTARIPDPAPLSEWVDSTAALSADSLKAHMEKLASPVELLEKALAWSADVNRRVAQLPPAQPFTGAVKALQKFSKLCEVWVVSSANHDALIREWEDAGLAPLTTFIAGQEKGTKGRILEMAAARFDPASVLMVGDAEGDAEAARQAGVPFFRIEAGHENSSWDTLIAAYPSNP